MDIQLNLLNRIAQVTKNFKQLLIQVTYQASLFDPNPEMSYLMDSVSGGQKRGKEQITLQAKLKCEFKIFSCNKTWTFTLSELRL